MNESVIDLTSLGDETIVTEAYENKHGKYHFLVFYKFSIIEKLFFIYVYPP